MSYDQPQRNPGTMAVSKSQADGVIGSHESLSKSASELADRLSALKNSIFGPEPEPAMGESGLKPQQPTAFFTRLDEAHERTKLALDRAQGIVSQLEQRFGTRQ